MWTPFPMSRSPFAKKKTSFAEATWPHTCISHSSVAHWHWLWLCHWDAIHSSSRTRSPISRAMELFTCRTYLYRIWRNKKKGNMSVLLPILLISLLSAVYLSVGICGRICEWTRRVDSHLSVRVQSTAPNHGTLNVIGRSCGVSNWFGITIDIYLQFFFLCIDVHTAKHEWTQIRYQCPTIYRYVVWNYSISMPYLIKLSMFLYFS